VQQRHRIRPWLAAGLLLIVLAAGAALSGGRMRPENAQAFQLFQGWDLIADPGGIDTSSVAYTLQQNDQFYEMVQPGTPLVAGLG
jgi:hypothetical protein